jgi:hypothetical protein
MYRNKFPTPIAPLRSELFLLRAYVTGSIISQACLHKHVYNDHSTFKNKLWLTLTLRHSLSRPPTLANKICPFRYIVILKQLTICLEYLSVTLLYFADRLLTVGGGDLFAIISSTDVYSH